MSSPSPLSLAKRTPVHFQQLMPDCRPISDRGPHKTGVDTNKGARKSKKLLHPLLPQFADPKIERQYRDARLEYRMTALKVTIIAGVFISMVFAALVSLIDSVVEQLSQVFMLRVFHVGTIC
jgi:hypothetical protein